MELLKDYDYIILYHPSETNVVVNALSHKFIGNLACISKARILLIKEIQGLEANGIKFEIKEPRVLLAHVELRLTLMDQIKAA